jgi:hypothetical protein
MNASTSAWELGLGFSVEPVIAVEIFERASNAVIEW